MAKAKSVYFFMKFFPQKLNRFPFFFSLLLLALSACAEKSITSTNIKKTNDALLETKTSEKSKVPQQPEVVSPEQPSGPIPMSTFMSPPPKNVIKSSNRWFARLQAWAKIYRDLAKQEQAVRNYRLSAQLSISGLLWANRSIEIKDLTNDKAIVYVQMWVNQLRLPDAPEEPTYFTGREAFEKIMQTRKVIADLDHRFCLISQGLQMVPTLAYLETATTLMNQKRYNKAMVKIQNGAGLIGNMEREANVCAKSEFVEPK